MLYDFIYNIYLEERNDFFSNQKNWRDNNI